MVGDEQAVKICSNNTLKRNQLVTQAEAKLVRVSFHVETTDHTHRGFLVYYKGVLGSTGILHNILYTVTTHRAFLVYYKGVLGSTGILHTVTTHRAFLVYYKGVLGSTGILHTYYILSQLTGPSSSTIKVC